MGRILIQPSALRFIASGSLFLTAFGALWLIFGVRLLWAWNWRALLLITVGTLALTGAAIGIWNMAQHAAAPGFSTPKVTFPGAKFGIVSTLEFVLIFLVAFILARAGRPDLIFQAVALIVGLHFIPLAAIFGERLYYFTGGVMILIAFAAFGSQNAVIRQAVTCFGCGGSLWMTSVALLSGRM